MTDQADNKQKHALYAFQAVLRRPLIIEKSIPSLRAPGVAIQKENSPHEPKISKKPSLR